MVPPAITVRVLLGTSIVGGPLGLLARYGAGNPHEIVTGWVPKFVDHT